MIFRQILKFAAGPLVGTRGSAAMGRVAFIIGFGVAVYFWLCRPAEAFPPTLFEILIALMVYNFTSKGVSKFGRTEPKCSKPLPNDLTIGESG